MVQPSMVFCQNILKGFALVPLLFLLLIPNVMAQGSPKALWRKPGHNNHIHKLLFDPSGQFIYSAAHDRLIHIRRVQDGQLIRTINSASSDDYNNGLVDLTRTSDGTRIAGAAYNFFKVWWLNEPRERLISTGQGWVESLRYSGNGLYLAAGSENGMINIYDGNDLSLKKSFAAHTQRVNAIAFSPDGQFMATAGDNDIKIWKVGDWVRVARMRSHKNEVYSLAFSRRGQFLASGSADNTIKLWQTQNWTIKQTLRGHSYTVSTLIFTPDDQKLYSADGPGNSIRIWSVPQEKLLRTYNDLNVEQTRSIAISPQGYIAWGGDKQIVNMGKIPGY